MVYVAVVVPYKIGFSISSHPWETAFVVDAVVDVYFLMDVFLSFRSACLTVVSVLNADTRSMLVAIEPRDAHSLTRADAHDSCHTNVAHSSLKVRSCVAAFYLPNGSVSLPVENSSSAYLGIVFRLLASSLTGRGRMHGTARV